MHVGLLTFVLSPNDVKRIGPEEAPEVEKLILKNTTYLFGETPVVVHLERSYLSLGIYNPEKELAGVLCLNCFPNIPALPPWEWDHFLHKLYGIDGPNPLTTLWIHYAVWDRRYTTLFLKPLLQHVFQFYETIQIIFMICPPGISKLDFIDEYSTREIPPGYINPFRVQTLYVLKKDDFVSHYVIRRAVEEDNDDLVAIIPKIVQKHYGDYYISELLSLEEDSGRQIIVAEYKGSAVGVLCLNECINYDLLNEEFELVPYNGLKKHDSADEVLLQQPPSATLLQVTEDSNERLSRISIPEEAKYEDEIVKTEDETSDDDFSLVNLSSSLIFFLYDEEDMEPPVGTSDSDTSIESHFSAVVLNEDYEDHLYNAEKGGDSADGEERKSIRRKESRQDAVVIPTFYGEPNAFAMEICEAVADHENCLYLLFQAAFECFPDRDYIVCSFPTDSKNSYLIRHFARVVPRCNSVFNHELYVLHKSAIMGKLHARVSIPEDRVVIGELLASLARPLIIEEEFKEAVEIKSSPLRAYTFLSDKQIIGCAIVLEEQEHDYLSLHYNIDTWMKIGSAKFGSLGSLEQFVLSPIFQRHLTFFTRELHRLSNFDVLFYRLKRYDYMYNHRTLPISNAIKTMMPALPLQIPEYSKEARKHQPLPQTLLKYHQPFGLYISTIPATSMRTVEINQKIVIIGAGSTTINFLEALIFKQNPNYMIKFTNITVVSPHGISYHKQPSPIREQIFVSDGHLDRRYVDSICLKTYVHVVTGVMASINRKEKYVGLNDDSYIPYDYLFLLCGEQFQKPPLKKKEVVKKKVDFPQNVFIINTEADAGNAFNALKNLTSDQKQGQMVVFGHYLEALCCLGALIEYGVPSSNLIYVDPSYDHIQKIDNHDHLTNFFNNCLVEQAVIDEILSQGVTIYQDYNFVDWYLDSTKTFINCAKFESKYKFVEITLSALFIYHSRGVSAKTFQAIAKSGLVFNGRLVIDKNCQTNDPYIYGAGSLTMYSKKYYAEHLMHKFYSPHEIGYMLGNQIRRKLVPQKFWDPPTKAPILREPIVQFCKFPGNLFYLQVSKPGPPVPLDVAMNKSNYGRVLITGDARKLDKQGYFRLHLNQFQAVETITCLSKFELNVHNLSCLWGKHEVLLNHLLLRFDNNMIGDFFEFFDQQWACAIYHRLFPDVLDEINSILSSAETAEGVKLLDEIQSRLEKNEWNSLTKMQADEIEEMCRDINLISKIEQEVLEFLHGNYMYLPMYAHQMFIRWIIHQTSTSPLFIKTIFQITTDRRSITQGNPFYERMNSHSKKWSQEYKKAARGTRLAS